ncbi:sensor histidine kinase [Aquimarina sp. M1]
MLKHILSILCLFIGIDKSFTQVKLDKYALKSELELYKKRGDSLRKINRYNASAKHFNIGYKKACSVNSDRYTYYFGRSLMITYANLEEKNYIDSINQIYQDINRLALVGCHTKELIKNHLYYALAVRDVDTENAFRGYAKAVALIPEIRSDSVLISQIYRARSDFFFKIKNYEYSKSDAFRAYQHISSKHTLVEKIKLNRDLIVELSNKQVVENKELVNNTFSYCDQCKYSDCQEVCLSVYSNLMIDFRNMKDYKTADYILLDKINLDSVKKNATRSTYHKILNHYQQYDQRQQNYDKAIVKLKQLKQFALKYEEEDIALYANYLAHVYAKIGDYKRAFDESNAAYIYSERYRSPSKKLAELQQETFEKSESLENKNNVISSLSKSSLEINKDKQNLKNYWVFTVALALVISLLLIIYIQFQRLRLLKIKEEATFNKMNSLQIAMNPHFLFNSFNSIQKFVLFEENKLATKYIGKMASLIRNYFYCAERRFISFTKELEILKHYIDLEKIRFEDKIDVKFDIDIDLKSENFLIPSLILQPFVENSIKHGFTEQKDKYLIHIRFKINKGYLQCRITDNGTGILEVKRAKTQDHLSIATKNIRDRLKLLNQTLQRKASFTVRNIEGKNNTTLGTEVEVVLPIL